MYIKNFIYNYINLLFMKYAVYNVGRRIAMFVNEEDSVAFANMAIGAKKYERLDIKKSGATIKRLPEETAEVKEEAPKQVRKTKQTRKNTKKKEVQISVE